MLWLQVISVLLFLISMSYLLGRMVRTLLFAKLPATLDIPLGFITFQAVFWLLSIVIVYGRGHWTILFWVVTTGLTLLLGSCLWFLGSQRNVHARQQQSVVSRMSLLIVCLIGIIHGLLQVGFWNVDNSMSDNSFYLSVATAAINNPHLFAQSVADGMAQTTILSDYVIATYELSIAYLGAFFTVHPTIIFRLILPVFLSLATLLSVYTLFLQLTKGKMKSLIGVLVFVAMIYFSANYKGNLNDFTLEEWFQYYYYVGKAIVRFLIFPTLVSVMIATYDACRFHRLYSVNPLKQNADISRYIILYSLIGLSCITLSPGSIIYYLVLLLVFFSVLLFDKKVYRHQIIILGVGASFVGAFGLLLSFITKLTASNGTPIVSTTTSLNIGQFFGVGSTFFGGKIFYNFIMSGNFSDEYWYVRYSHVLLLLLCLIMLSAKIIGAVLVVLNRKCSTSHRIWRAWTKQFWRKHYQAVFFGAMLPLSYICFVFLPPIVEAGSMALSDFGYQRLLGNYPYEITGIALLLLIIQYVVDSVSLWWSRKYEVQQPIVWKKACFSIVVFILVWGIIVSPQPYMTYEYAMSSLRKERLKFQDNYYNGSFDYQLLLQNPYKLDSQASQIVSILTTKEGDKIVAGTINQFFGLSHVRTYDPTIKVVKTRFSQYQDENLSNAAYLLKVYFSPWDADFGEYHKSKTPEDVKQALNALGVKYIVIIKSYKDQPYFGQDTIAAFREIISEIAETEQFYVATLA